MSRALPGRLEVVVATSNPGKLREIREILGDLPLVLRSLGDFPALRMPEESDAYAENAAAKALTVARETGRVSVADDSGLEVDGLDGAPGARSARYGGPDLDDAGRVQHLLRELASRHGAARAARFVCVAALATPDGDVVTARGECAGRILEAPVGSGGFGYDPVFESSEAGLAMAQLSAAEKNRLSHRARAFRALREPLRALARRG
ncbi:MAG: RdgB/HAM1 family non-canonical purine NTP pyrophosphatase [Myxococcales bacterium]|nr:RdgB/HAM1 family non-canonical purine NTP pyrophosphatase [Myxococcales bacterium]